jgi:hypothetical protein
VGILVCVFQSDFDGVRVCTLEITDLGHGINAIDTRKKPTTTSYSDYIVSNNNVGNCGKRLKLLTTE